MKTYKTILGKNLKVSVNHSKKTFTIRTDAAKYRTFRMSKEEFNSCLHNTGNDWDNFLRSDDYYEVR